MSTVFSWLGKYILIVNHNTGEYAAVEPAVRWNRHCIRLIIARRLLRPKPGLECSHTAWLLATGPGVFWLVLSRPEQLYKASFGVFCSAVVRPIAARPGAFLPHIVWWLTTGKVVFFSGIVWPLVTGPGVFFSGIFWPLATGPGVFCLVLSDH
jgi:hypothetical protein